MKKIYLLSIITTVASTPLVASAHEEILTSGSYWDAFVHIITGFDHIITIVVVVTAIALSQVIQRRSIRTLSVLTAVAGTVLLAFQ